MTYEEAIKIIEIAKAEVEWNYPMEYQEAFDIAIDCIEKQTPKKPINATGYYRDNKCPSCGKPIKSGNGSSSHYRNDWCNKCGQRISWEVE